MNSPHDSLSRSSPRSLPLKPLLRDWPTLLAMVLALLLLAPIAALLPLGLGRFEVGTLRHLVDTVLLPSTWTSLLLAAGTLFGALCLGVGAAWCIERTRFPGHGLVAWLLVLPLAMPTYVIAYAYTDLLQFSGPVQRWLRATLDPQLRLPDIRSLEGAILLFSLVLYPYIYLIARTSFGELSASLIESARTMGVRGVRVFTRIALPIAAPAIGAASMLVLMETLADVGATYYFGLQTFSSGIYSAWFALGDRGAALLLAMALLLLVGLMFIVERRLQPPGRGRTGSAHRPWAPRRLRGLPAVAMIALLLLPVVGGFMLPVAALVWAMLRSPEQIVDPERFSLWAWNSAQVAIVAATLIVALALLFSWSARLSRAVPVAWPRRASLALRFGYAVPGAVIALAVLWPLAWVDRAIADLLDSPRLWLSGSVLALHFAYLLRFFAVAHGPIDAASARIPQGLDDACRTMGSSRARIFTRVHLPLLARATAVGWMLCVIDVMKELPATLMLRPFNFDTLAVVTQHLAQDERLVEAALPALAIVGIGMLPVIGLSGLLSARATPTMRSAQAGPLLAGAGGQHLEGST